MDATYAADVIATWASRYLAPEAVLPELEPLQDQVLVQETGAGKFQVEVRTGTTRFLADEPAAAGGLGSGPNPYDLLCAALGACTSMTLRLYADQKQWPLARTRVAVRHAKDKDRKPADLFTRSIALEGPLDSAQRTRLMEIANKCPVHRTLESGSAIVTAEVPTPIVSSQPDSARAS